MHFFIFWLSNEVLFKQTSVDVTLQSECANICTECVRPLTHSGSITIPGNHCNKNIKYNKKYERSQVYLQQILLMKI